MNPPEPDPAADNSFEGESWLSLDVIVEDPAWVDALGAPEAFARATALACFDLLPDTPVSAASFSIMLADNEIVQGLNAQFRGQDKPTNVLSFPSLEPDDGLGDIVIAYQVTAAEALDQGKAFQHHARHLIVHGILHLLGYDHIDDSEAEIMEALERQILARFGIPDPYVAFDGDGGIDGGAANFTSQASQP